VFRLKCYIYNRCICLVSKPSFDWVAALKFEGFTKTRRLYRKIDGFVYIERLCLKWFAKFTNGEAV
jgi:hypothetical protein